MNRRRLVCFVATWSLVLFLSPALAQLPPRALSPADAVLVLDSPQAAAQAQAQTGGTVRCPLKKTVGVWVESPSPLTAEGLTITGCAVGVVVTGHGHTVRAMTIAQSAFTGMLCQGCAGGVISHNTIVDAEYGIFLIGHDNLIEANPIDRIARDGILLAGSDWNTVVGNTIRGVGGNGINLIAGLPLEGPRALIYPIRMLSWQNTIKENDVQGSGRFDLRQWPVNCKSGGGYPGNTWENNQFTTRSVWCLH
jgi:parallel beta-helix repeat protein